MAVFGVINSKKKHGSKKNKIAWRKNVDIQDVEDFLEDQRLEERLGTPFAKKPDDELFVIDTQPSEAADTNLRSRKQKAERPLACLSALQNTSKVPIPGGERKQVKGLKMISDKTDKKKLEKGVYRRKLDMAKRNRQLAIKKKQDIKNFRSEFKKDLWVEEPIAPLAVRPKGEWLTKNTVIINNLKAKPVRPSRSAPRAAAIVSPHPGTSYNPAFKDHQDLLQSVVTAEVKACKEEEHLNRVTSMMFRKIPPAQREAERLAEQRQGLDEAVEADDGTDYQPINPRVLRKKKDLKTRRHIREHNQEKARRLQEAREKKMMADVYKLRFLEKKVSAEAERAQLHRELRDKKRAENPAPPRLTRTAFFEPPLDFQAPSELSGSLRTCNPEGGGLVEQFVSLQRRGLASMSRVRTVKKAKTKRYTLPTHRLPWEQVEAPLKPSKRKQANIHF